MTDLITCALSFLLKLVPIQEGELLKYEIDFCDYLICLSNPQPFPQMPTNRSQYLSFIHCVASRCCYLFETTDFDKLEELLWCSK